MHIFLTGASGWVGSAVTQELLSGGHSVSGLVRSVEKADAFGAVGGRPIIGSLADLDVLRAAVRNADGIIHLAFGLDFSKIVEISAQDKHAIEAMGETLAATERPMVAVGGFGLSPPNMVFEESARPPVMPAFPRATEQTTFDLAGKGVPASVVRLPRSVHGLGERHGFIPMLAAVAREKGASAYVDGGDNLWPSVHRLDAARVFRLAIERGAMGQAYHAVADEGVPFRLIAEAIGRQVGVPTKSLTPEQAEQHFGKLAVWAAGNGPASSERTREALGWKPQQKSLIADIDRPEYYS